MKKCLEKLASKLGEHNNVEQLTIIDWDGYPKALIPQECGGCCVYPDLVPTLTNEDQAKGVLVIIKTLTGVISLGLKRNAWRRNGIGQCDAIVFPATEADGDAILLVEIKYSSKSEAWSRYKEKALKQITDTVTQLKNNGCPIKDRRIYGLISFPLLNVVSASVFSRTELIDLYMKKKIELYTGNRVQFINQHTVTL